MKYSPSTVPSNPADIPAFLRRELEVIQKAAGRADNFLQLQPLHAAPERTLPCMVVYADGTDWNPGSGAGYYGRNEANSAWVFLGGTSGRTWETV